MTTASPTIPVPETVFDAATMRRDFPIFLRKIHGHRLVYLDSAATSQKPQSVLQAIVAYYEQSNANVHRGVYLLAEEATEMYESARQAVADFIGCSDSAEVIFTRNASEAINLVAYTWAQEHVGPGDAIIITPEEHHSNFVPWQRLAHANGARLELVDLEADGSLDITHLTSILAKGSVRLVALTAVSNVLGIINPIYDVCQMAHEAGALVLVDAAQAAPHMPMDVKEWDADFVAFTGHKMLGPTGIGVLWGRRSHLEAMPPFLGGGEMIRRVTEAGSSWNDLPWKFEAGTPNIEGAVGLHAAIEYLNNLGMPAVREHERDLVRYALQQIKNVDGVTIYGPPEAERRGGVVAFNITDIHPHDLATILDSRGICVRAGHHCAQPLHERLGLAATARASFYVYNDEADVDALCEGLESAKKVMRTASA